MKPYVQDYWSVTGIRPVGGAVGTFEYFMLMMGCGICLVTMKEMPVFEPNEYFWKNHWDGKEEKVLLYCRIMQEIMAKELNVPAS